MSSFYGGRPGQPFIIMATFNSVNAMITQFKKGPNYTTVHYDENVVITTTDNSDDTNGNVYRRGYDYTNAMGGAELIGNIFSGMDMSNNAELADIRVGYDNTIYDSAGDAVREQVKNTNNAFEILYSISGKYVSPSTGGLITSSSGNYNATEMFSCTKLTKIILKNINTSSSVAAIAFYDKNGTFITGSALTDIDGNLEIESGQIPEAARFARCSSKAGSCFAYNERFYDKEIKAIENDVSNLAETAGKGGTLYQEIYPPITLSADNLAIGTITLATGVVNPSGNPPTRAFTKNIISVHSLKISVPNALKFVVFEYNNDGSFVPGTGVWVNDTDTHEYTDKNVRIVIAYDNNSALEDTSIFGNVSIEMCRENRIDSLESQTVSNTNKIAPLETQTFKINNPPVDLRKSNLRILDIGNSFTQDPTHYFADIVTASGVDTSDMCFEICCRGAASFKAWYDVYHDNDSSYYFTSKLFGGLSVVENGGTNARDGSRFRSLLTDNKWDLILIHQFSGYSTNYDEWEGSGDGGYLRELIRILKYHQPQACIGFTIVHASNKDATNKGTTTSARFLEIAEAVKKMRIHYGIDFVIPYGTAVENIRASRVNTSSHNLSRDNHHLGWGLGCYTAACAYYESMIAPRYGVSVLGNSCRHTLTATEENKLRESNSYDTYIGDCIDVTNENAGLAQMAAVLAVCDMFSINNPDDVNI